MPKRDMVLMKSILEAVEGRTRDSLSHTGDFIVVLKELGNSTDEATLDHNIYLLIDSGYIEGTAQWVGTDVSINIKGLTWSGHDLLENLRGT